MPASLDMLRLHETAIPVISRARAFGTHHRGAERTVGRAAGSKCRTFLRLYHSLKDKAADTLTRIFNVPVRHAKAGLRIKVGIPLRQGETTLWYLTYPSPASVHYAKDISD